MADDVQDKPWSAMHWGERTGVVVAVAFLVAVIGFIVIGAAVSTRQLFAEAPPNRLCSAATTSDCLTTIPATVKAADYMSFTAGTDRPPYTRKVGFPDGPIPVVGSRVVLEEWKGTIILFTDPEHERRRTDDWPDRGAALITAVVFNLFLWGGVALSLGGWLSGRKRRRNSPMQESVSEQPAQTS